MVEFMAATDFGKMTISELLVMAGMYANQRLDHIKPVLDAAQKFVNHLT
jgi:hypothetical protein